MALSTLPMTVSEDGGITYIQRIFFMAARKGTSDSSMWVVALFTQCDLELYHSSVSCAVFTRGGLELYHSINYAGLVVVDGSSRHSK